MRKAPAALGGRGSCFGFGGIALLGVEAGKALGIGPPQRPSPGRPDQKFRLDPTSVIQSCSPSSETIRRSNASERSARIR